jgi:PTS system fructose-specific IIC component
MSATTDNTALITAEMVDLDVQATTKDEATRHLAELLVATGRVSDLDGFLADVRAREAQMATGLEGGIGIPHCRSEHVTVPTVGFGKSADGVDYGAADGPAHLIFLIAAPAGADSDHMKILAALARRLVRQEFKDNLRAATDPAAVADYIRTEVTP